MTAKLLLLKICLPLTGLGIVNDLPKFISNLSERTAPLREMLRRYTNWSWEAPYQKAFEPLKLYISNPQSLFLWSCQCCCTWQIPHKEFIEKLKPVETDQKPLTAIVNKPLHIEPACLQESCCGCWGTISSSLTRKEPNYKWQTHCYLPTKKGSLVLKVIIWLTCCLSPQSQPKVCLNSKDTLNLILSSKRWLIILLMNGKLKSVPT